MRDLLEQLADPRVVRQRLDNELQRAAARQAPARRFLVGHAVGEELGFLRRRETRLHLLDEIVLDAAARDRADDLAVVADRDHRADRARRRAPGLDDGAERGLVPAFAPAFGGTQDFDIYAIHGEMLAQPGSPETLVRRLRRRRSRWWRRGPTRFRARLPGPGRCRCPVFPARGRSGRALARVPRRGSRAPRP